MDLFVFELIILVTVLAGIYYFTNQADVFSGKKAEWEAIQGQGKELLETIQNELQVLSIEKERVRTQAEVNDRDALVAVHAVLTGAALANQIPSIFPLTEIVERFYPGYSEDKMRCLFLSASNYDQDPVLYHNALFVIIHGKREASHRYAGLPFYQVHSNDGQLQVIKDYPEVLNAQAVDDLFLSLTKLIDAST